VLGCAISWYRIVEPAEAHLVTSPKGRIVASSDQKISDTRYYFAVSGWIPLFGKQVRVMDVTVKELVTPQETIEFRELSLFGKHMRKSKNLNFLYIFTLLKGQSYFSRYFLYIFLLINSTVLYFISPLLHRFF